MKATKRILSLVVTVAMLLSMATVSFAALDTASWSWQTSELTTELGATLQLPLGFTAAPGMAGLSFTIEYPTDVFTVDSGKQGPNYKCWTKATATDWDNLAAGIGFEQAIPNPSTAGSFMFAGAAFGDGSAVTEDYCGVSVDNIPINVGTLKMTVTSEAAKNNAQYDITIKNIQVSDGAGQPHDVPNKVVKVTVGQVSQASTDAKISALTINDGAVALSPAFDAETIAYTASVPYETESVTVAAGAPAAGTVTVNGDANSKVIDLAVGENTVTVIGKAEDGTTTKTYTIVITRAAYVPSNVSALAGLTVTGADITPAFDAATLAYTATVASTVESVTVAATAPALGSVKINGEAVASKVVTLTEGLNTITVVGVAEDLSETTYTIEITKEAAYVPSNVSALAGLTVTGADITPAFDAATLAYTATVAYTVDSVTVAATAPALGSVKINGEAVASKVVTLVEGANAIEVKGIAEDLTETTYTITITKEAAPAPTVPKVTIGAADLAYAGTTVTIPVTLSDIPAGGTVGGVELVINYPAAAFSAAVENVVTSSAPAVDVTTDGVVTVAIAANALTGYAEGKLFDIVLTKEVVAPATVYDVTFATANFAEMEEDPETTALATANGKVTVGKKQLASVAAITGIEVPYGADAVAIQALLDAITAVDVTFDGDAAPVSKAVAFTAPASFDTTVVGGTIDVEAAPAIDAATEENPSDAKATITLTVAKRVIASIDASQTIEWNVPKNTAEGAIGLPTTVTVLFEDGGIASVPVEALAWNTAYDPATVGAYTFTMQLVIGASDEFENAATPVVFTGTVNVTGSAYAIPDVQATLDHIVGIAAIDPATQPDLFDKLDINGDDVLDIADAVAIVYDILTNA